MMSIAVISIVLICNIHTSHSCHPLLITVYSILVTRVNYHSFFHCFFTCLLV